MQPQAQTLQSPSIFALGLLSRLSVKPSSLEVQAWPKGNRFQNTPLQYPLPPPRPFLKLTQAPWGLPCPWLVPAELALGGWGPEARAGGGQGRKMGEAHKGSPAGPHPCLGLLLVGKNEFEAEQGLKLVFLQ